MSAPSTPFMGLAEQHARFMAARSRMWSAGRAVSKPPAVSAVLAIAAPQPASAPARRRKIAEFAPGERWSVADLLTLVVRKTGHSADDLTGPSRRAVLVRARQTFCWLAYRFGRAGVVIGRDRSPSLPALGQFIGGRDHTTVLHAVRRVDAVLAGEQSIPAGPRACLDRLVALGFVRAAR